MVEAIAAGLSGELDETWFEAMERSEEMASVRYNEYAARRAQEAAFAASRAHGPPECLG